MSGNWCRLYGDMIHNPKIGQLSDSEFRLYISLLCLATNANELSEDNDGNTKHTPEEAAWVLRCNVTETLQKLIETNLVTFTETKTIKIIGWDNHQKKSDNSTARVQKYRQNKASKDETLQKRYSNGLEKELELELEKSISDTNVSLVDKPQNATSPTRKEIPGTKNKKSTCPHKDIIALYHEKLPMCPTVREWTNGRAAKLRTRWDESKSRQSMEWWAKFFEYVAQSKFLTGRGPVRGESPPFLVDLEWLVSPTNMAKVIEGKYHRDKQK